jgi:hypothetical protein
MINIANSTQQSERSPTITDWLTAFGTIGSLVGAIGIGAYSLYLTRKGEERQIQRQILSEQRQGLSQVFQLLNDNAHRNARRRIYNLYQEYDDSRKEKILKKMGVKDEDLKRINAIHMESMEIVKADFDQIGSLVENSAILKDEFLKIYWHELLKCWKVLDDDINEIRKTLRDDNYMINFEKLKGYAEEFKNTGIDQIDIKKDVIVGPRIISVTPIMATPKYRIQILFDGQMDDRTISEDKVSLKDSSGRGIPGTISWDPLMNTATFETDISKLQSSQTYTLVISKRVKDNTGFQMEQDYQSPISDAL